MCPNGRLSLVQVHRDFACNFKSCVCVCVCVLAEIEKPMCKCVCVCVCLEERQDGDMFWKFN